ncbi:MAG: hypothetical protein Q7U82_12415 [Gammaproteobacteria bacterium]|nr:hypothetical protein [Gammaproteobacteria bacterium]
MSTLEPNLIKYLKEVTGASVELTPMSVGGLPLYLENQYRFYNLSISSLKFTAVFLQAPQTFTPAQFQKHLARAIEHAGFTCVVAESLPAYVRKRLIELGQAFVVPGVQMYLPMLGMELRSRAKREALVAAETLSPASQAVLIYCLLHADIKEHTPLALSKALCYSAMSMSRAVSELSAARLVVVNRQGKERLMRLQADAKEIWLRAQPLLRQPVTQSYRIWETQLEHKPLLLAGESALSRLTLLGEPEERCYAISKAQWQLLEKAGIEKIPIREPETCIVQVWAYDPNLLAEGETVDPFSLSLSLKGSADERIEMALDAMMER